MSVDRVLSQLLASGAASGFAGGLAGGLASGLLTSKAGREFGGKALRVGGIAAVGGLAYAAWSRYRAGADAASRPPDGGLEGFVPAPDSPQEAEALGLLLLRAMVAAAHADGRLDGRERHAIRGHVASLDLPDAEKARLLACIERPVGMEELVASATRPEIAAEIYTAALLAMDVDTVAERAWLVMLAARLGLPDDLVVELHRELGVAHPDALPYGEAQPAIP